MRRRDFLRASAVGAGGVLLAERVAHAAWGDAPTADSALELLGPGDRAEKCLEVFLYGGMGCFESFYVVPEYGAPDDPNPALRGQQWYSFQNRHQEVFGGDCGWSDPATWMMPWKPDSLGMTVNLGPIVRALRERPDLLERMRVVVMQHDLEPHEAAIPLALSGFRLGNPRMAGMGAHVQRYFAEREPSRITPFSYVFMPSSSFSTDNVLVASAVGMHPGSARPLSIKVSNNTNIGDLIGREVVGADSVRLDPLLDWYADRARARYSDPVSGLPLRSHAIDDHQYAIASLLNAENLQAIITPDILDAFPGDSCKFDNNEDIPGMSLKAAVQLLQDPTQAARYVNVIDGGLEIADGGGGYDTHFEHLETQASNLNHTLSEIAARINAPAEGDPDKLDLDETMVLVTTEFGRTPFSQGAKGSNHHPYGYVQIILGGPVKADHAGVGGAIGPDGVAVEFLTPSEFRAGMLLGMGMYPFSPESFAVGDIRDITSELEGLVWLKERVLGRSV